MPIQISRPNEDSDDIPMIDSKEMRQVREHNVPTSNISRSYIQISRKKFSGDKNDRLIEQQRDKIFEQAKKEEAKAEERLAKEVAKKEEQVRKVQAKKEKEEAARKAKEEQNKKTVIVK